MGRPLSSLWFYQRILLTCFAIMFMMYAIALSIPVHIVILYLLFVIPGAVAPERVCKSVPVLFSHRVLLNYCGSILPLCAAILILVHGDISWYYVVALTSISIALTSLHTYVMDKLILVNVARYFTSFVTLSFAILGMDKLLHVMPFAITIGVIAGSDLIPYIVTSLVNKNRKTINIGGFMALDTISVSLMLAIAILAILVHLLDWL